MILPRKKLLSLMLASSLLSASFSGTVSFAAEAADPGPVRHSRAVASGSSARGVLQGVV